MYFIQRSIVYIQIISNVVSCMSCISLSWKEFVPWKKHYMEIDTERWFLTLSFARIFQVLCEQSSKSLSRLEFSAQKIRFEFAGCFFLRFFFITCLVLIPLWLKCVASQPETAVAVGLFLFSWVSKDLAQRIPPGHAQILTRDLALALGSRVHSLHRFKDFKNDWWNDLHFWTSREGRVDLKRDSVLRRVPHWVCILLDCTLVLNVARGKWFFQNRNGEKTIRKQFLFQVFAVFFLFSFLFFPFFCMFFLWGTGVGHGENAATASGARIEHEKQKIEGIERIDAAAVWRLVTAGCPCTACTACTGTWSTRTVLQTLVVKKHKKHEFHFTKPEQAKVAQNTNSVHRTRVASWQVGFLPSEHLTGMEQC